MRLTIKFLIFIWGILLSIGIKAQNNQTLKFDYLTIDQGLSNNRAYCVLQDKAGFLWIGTTYGLNRYDGYQFKQYYYDEVNEYTINANTIYTLYEDSDNILWVGFNGAGLCKYDRQKDRFVRCQSLGKYTVRGMLEDEEKRLWVYGDGVFGILNKTTGIFKNLAQKLDSQKIRSVCKAGSKDAFWVATFDDGLYFLNIKTFAAHKYHPESNNSNSISSKIIRKIYLDSMGMLWIGTSDQGLDSFDTHSQTFSQDEYLGIHSISTILEVDNTIWIGTFGGLFIFNKNTKTFTHYGRDSAIPHNLTSNSIADESNLYQDQQGRILICTYYGGVNIAVRKAERFTKQSIAFADKSIGAIFQKNIINALLKDKKNRLWVGTENGLVKIENGKTTYCGEPRIQTEIQILSLAIDKKERIWVGRWDGLFWYEEKSNKLNESTYSQLNRGNIAKNKIFGLSLSQDSSYLYLATTGELILMPLEEPNNFISIPIQNCNSLTESSFFLQVYEDAPKQDLWIATTQGLVCYNLKTQRTICYQHNPNNPKSISSNLVMNFLKDKQGRYWIGTNAGLNKITKNNEFEHFTTKDGLPDNIIQSLIEDNQGSLWISTNKGLSKFDPIKRKFRNFTVSDGLINDQFIHNACFKDQAGFLYFGSIKGINIFHPDNVLDNSYIPPVYILSLKILNKVVKIGDYDSLLRNDISQTKEIRLLYQYATFSFEFAALNYIQSHKNQYAYKLENFDQDWNYIGNKREAIYTSLPAGEYTFRVKACNNDGLWNELGASLKVIILPPWWRTWWFRSIVIVITVFLGFTLYKMRTNQLKTESNYRQELLEVSIEVQENERKRIASDLHDSIGAKLSAIKLFTNQIYNKASNNILPLEITLQTKDLIDETIQNIRQISRDLLPATLERFGLQDAIQELCDKINAAESIQIHLENDFDGQRLEVKKELALFRVTQELISNTLKYAEASQIQLKYHWDENDNCIHLLYIDNGHGFDFNLIRNSTFAGLGLKNIESRVKAVKGTVHIFSEISKGMSAEITIPIKE